MSIAPEIDRLSVNTCDVKPRDIDWNPEDARGEYIEPTHQWWQSFTYELEVEREPANEDDDMVITTHEVTLVANGGSVAGVMVDGTLYEDFDTYFDAHAVYPSDDDATGTLPAEAFTEDEFATLMSVEPYQWGAEGPMMNYWYPVNEQDREYSRFEPKDAAGKLDHLPVCVVLVDDEYGLALTGGGMDLSWEICDAFIALGFLPPVHFADLPAMASRWTDMHQRVYDGMARALDWTREQMEYRRTRLDDLRERMSSR